MGKKKQQTTKQHKPRPQKPRVQSGLAAESSDPQATTVALNGLTVGSLAGQPSARPLRQAAVMQMQRQNGNAGVVRRLEQYSTRNPFAGGREDHGQNMSPLLSPSQLSRLRIQRFISSEHQSLGDATGENFPAGTLFPGSPEMSYGEVVAISGDLYGSYDDMASEHYILADGKKDMTPGSKQRKIDELNALKNLLRVEGKLVAAHQAKSPDTEFEPGGLDTGTIADPDTGVEVKGYELATGGRYSALALDNFLHFSAGGENLNAWKEGHKLALTEAFQAGINQDVGALAKAMARNAASNHYLTDAFSSGHMRVPRRCADEYYRALMDNALDGVVESLVNALPENIEFSIPLGELSDYVPDWAPDLPDINIAIPLPLRGWMRDASGSLADSLRPTADFVGKALGGLVSKWLHDTDNKRGLWVSNDASGRWQAFGDAFLDKPGEGTGTTNRAEAVKAVRADVAEVRKMFDAGKQAAANKESPGPVPSAVFFPFDAPRGEGDAAAISGDGAQSLDALAAYLQTVDGVTVSLTGWADSRGSEKYNAALSARRISAVHAYLVSRGAPADKFGAETPMGEPLAPTSADNHDKFRRVDVALIGTPTPKPAGDEQKPPGPLPPEIEGPYAAEQFIPRVESNNPPMDPYEWSDITEPDKRSEISEKARDMLKGKVGGMAMEIIDKHLDNYGPYKIDIPIPIVGTKSVTLPSIPIRKWAISLVTPAVKGAIEDVLTDSTFSGLMDGASAKAASVPAQESDQTCN